LWPVWSGSFGFISMRTSFASRPRDCAGFTIRRRFH
jgi:hypothetical protein